jgi:L-asparaginase
MNPQTPIRILSVGGTFHKEYDPHEGTLYVDTHAHALHSLARRWRTTLTIETLIGKDSLEMDDDDRQQLVKAAMRAPERTLIVVHGTDTLDQSAATIARAALDKRIVFTGAMVPYAFDPVEATANFASAIGFALATETSGVYIALNGCVGPYDRVRKDRSLDRFVCR